jgi:hypothetical protein
MESSSGLLFADMASNNVVWLVRIWRHEFAKIGLEPVAIITSSLVTTVRDLDTSKHRFRAKRNTNGSDKKINLIRVMFGTSDGPCKTRDRLANLRVAVQVHFKCLLTPG